MVLRTAKEKFHCEFQASLVLVIASMHSIMHKNTVAVFQCFLNVSKFLHLAFHSNLPRVDPVIGKLLGKHRIIRVNIGISDIDKLDILELARQYAPDTPIVETAQVIKRRF